MNVHCYEEGSVLFAGAELTTTTIANTVFENNTAVLGGVMFIEQQSVVNWKNCTFTNNLAVEGGVVATADDGYFIFSNSTFRDNIGTAGLIANIFLSNSEASFVGWTISMNVFVSP